MIKQGLFSILLLYAILTLASDEYCQENFIKKLKTCDSLQIREAICFHTIKTNPALVIETIAQCKQGSHLLAEIDKELNKGQTTYRNTLALLYNQQKTNMNGKRINHFIQDYLKTGKIE